MIWIIAYRVLEIVDGERKIGFVHIKILTYRIAEILKLKALEHIN